MPFKARFFRVYVLDKHRSQKSLVCFEENCQKAALPMTDSITFHKRPLLEHLKWMHSRKLILKLAPQSKNNGEYSIHMRREM